MTDVYFNPEKFDLEVLGELEMHDFSWDFDYVVAWRHTPTGDIYYARDSGCSCPSPFEDYNNLGSLTKVSSGTFGQLEEDTKDCYRPTDRADFLRKVRDALGTVTLPTG